jgi:hypothetical protein
MQIFLEVSTFCLRNEIVKPISYLMIATLFAAILTATSHGQSWGFVLPGGGGFAYSSGRGGVSVASGGYGGAISAGGPYVYYPSATACQPAIFIPQGPGFGSYGPIPAAGYIRRGPVSNFTSYWVRYPNIW